MIRIANSGGQPPPQTTHRYGSATRAGTGEEPIDVIELFQVLPGPVGHGEQRVVGNPDGHTRFFGQATVDTQQQCASAGKDNAVTLFYFIKIILSMPQPDDLHIRFSQNPFLIIWIFAAIRNADNDLLFQSAFW